ncbi:uncharacterized protein LOC134249248 [Saccostrea cucullata]|uniref:uncharacterized protein LOC134249248 n=1 Tax=Saccostrea cuccullata TaxID=36930 RepID=UPI002ED07843
MRAVPLLLVLCCSLLVDSYTFSQIHTELLKQIDAQSNIRENRALRQKRMINEDPPEEGILGPLLPPDPATRVTTPKPTSNSKRKDKTNKQRGGPRKEKRTKSGQGRKKSDMGRKKAQGKKRTKKRKQA